MDTITLPRTGDAPLKFTGLLLASADSTRDNGPGQNRWHRLQLYRTAGGRYIVAISYRSHWGECPDDRAVVADSPEAVRAEVLGYDPLRHFIGRPVGTTDGERKNDLVATDLRSRFGEAVTELFEFLDEFTEVLQDEVAPESA